MEPVAETGLVLKENRNAGTLRFRHWVGGLFLISYFLSLRLAVSLYTVNPF